MHPPRLVGALLCAGATGAVLLLPAVSFVGSMLLPSMPAPPQEHVAPLLGEAMWARARGGRATELQPLNPFTIARFASCQLFAERHEDRAARDQEQDACMALLPAIQAVGLVATRHLQSVGVWQDIRVPFAALATVRKMSNTWTRAELLDALGASGEFGPVFIGADAAARGYFGRSVVELDLSQIALLAATLGERRVHPWCWPEHAARVRQGILERMHQNGVIDLAAADAATRTSLGITATPPAEYPPCPD